MEAARLVCAVKMCDEARKYGYPLYIVEDSPDPEIGKNFEAHGAIVIRQKGKGFGNSVRECLQAGLDGGHEIILRTEIEKYGLAGSVGACVERFRKENLDVLIPRRRNLDGYPNYQRLSEFMAMWEISVLTGRSDIDWFFGPKFLSPKAAERFIAYDGSQGDTWHILILPILQILAYGQEVLNPQRLAGSLSLGTTLLDYLYSPEQAAVEAGNPEMDKKRDVQRVQLVSAVKAECERLGIIGLR